MIRLAALMIGLSLVASSVWAQSTRVGFGTVQDNSGLPVEVTSDRLDVDENTGLAIFRDNVVVVQGEMRLSADELTVFYDTVLEVTERLEAVGNVIFISGPDVAESKLANYYPATGILVMEGDVLVIQEPNTITSDEMTVYVDQGTAELRGRVRTVLQTDSDEEDEEG